MWSILNFYNMLRMYLVTLRTDVYIYNYIIYYMIRNEPTRIYTASTIRNTPKEKATDRIELFLWVLTPSVQET